MSLVARWCMWAFHGWKAGSVHYALKVTRAARVMTKGTDQAALGTCQSPRGSFLPETLNKTRSLGAHMRDERMKTEN